MLLSWLEHMWNCKMVPLAYLWVDSKTFGILPGRLHAFPVALALEDLGKCLVSIVIRSYSIDQNVLLLYV